ncbi:CYFA0S17e01552g1_1 [Cyberlindnera fabianii]|uniref:Phosphatidylglycerol/phosphatidylinositol transfer protein n=1 Tax=Cyberlindnera fabianii TaxID=36022 RepID=A0A061B5T5_CYBFA|nr:Phosphatidylglycerol/phosphatidylinositol transfer protein [Cyberlindnera fabianii]CDR45321.1 CYFA0S17e01552g1_1 [Cyberlindnera fabianii]
MVAIKTIFCTLLYGSAALGLSLGPLVAREEQDLLKSNTLPGDKPIPGDNPVSICDATEKQILKIDLVDLTPNPPQRGANLSITATGTLSEKIEEGAYVDVEVRFGYIKLLTQTYDLCEQVGEVDLECPLDKGEYKLAKTVEIPQEVPPGKYTVYARAYTKDDEFITCITATVVFSIDAWKIIDFSG